MVNYCPHSTLADLLEIRPCDPCSGVPKQMLQVVNDERRSIICLTLRATPRSVS